MPEPGGGMRVRLQEPNGYTIEVVYGMAPAEPIAVARQPVNSGAEPLNRAGEVMRLLGEHLPTVTLSHQYLVTEDVPELAGRTARLPLLRDPDTSWYLRQERGGFLLGPYERNATPLWPDGIPADFAHKLFNDDLARLEPCIADACARVPLLGRVGVRRVVNGPIPYSPDGNP